MWWWCGFLPAISGLIYITLGCGNYGHYDVDSGLGVSEPRLTNLSLHNLERLFPKKILNNSGFSQETGHGQLFQTHIHYKHINVTNIQRTAYL